MVQNRDAAKLWLLPAGLPDRMMNSTHVTIAKIVAVEMINGS